LERPAHAVKLPKSPLGARVTVQRKVREAEADPAETREELEHLGYRLARDEAVQAHYLRLALPVLVATREANT
jgi:hypothetical protein